MRSPARSPPNVRRTLKYLIQHPEPIGIERDLPDAGDVVDVARAVEAAGWDGLAFTEHPAPGYRWLAEGGGHQTLDPFVALGAAAAVTERIMLLTYLAVVPYRNPMLLAKAATTVDLLSGGRFVLGVGTGYLKGEFFALGADFEERNALFDEALDVLPLYWSGERFTYDGRHFSARDIIARPAPVNRSIPIWIGGNSKLTRRRVAARAQGWMPMSGPAEMAKTTRTAHLSGLDDIALAVRDIKEMAGGRADDIDVMVLYTDPSILRPDVDVERHRDALGRIAEIGATWVSFAWDFSTQVETLDFVEGFAAHHLGSQRQ
jgi:probable F420-dependent oxidoreductase